MIAQCKGYYVSAKMQNTLNCNIVAEEQNSTFIQNECQI